MKKVLVVAHYFPPVGGAGVQRAAKFVKYLPEFGWKPSVLTAENPSVPVFDESLLNDIPAETSIFRTKTLEPSYAKKEALGKSSLQKSGLKKIVSSTTRTLVKGLLLPDPQILWWPHTALKMFRLLKEEKVDIVFATAPPFSVLVLATFVSRLRKIPVIVDFRDEWVFARGHLENAQRGCFAQWIDKLMERYVVSRCSGFVAATQSYVDGLYQRHPKLVQGKGLAITNGFDEDDFVDVEKKDISREEQGKIRILYTGTVWKATSLRPFIKALKKAIEIEPSLKKTISFTIIGRIVDEEKDYLNDPNLTKIVKTCGYLDHKKVVSEMVNADLLLLTLSDLEGAGRIIPGKTFEYIATGKQVLAIIPEGETFNLLKQNYVNANVFSPKEVADIKNFLIDLASQSTDKSAVDLTARENLSRRYLTNSLSNFFAKLVASEKKTY